MAEKVVLRTLKCPSCGAPVKTENINEAIPCVYCGNKIIPTVESTHNEKEEAAKAVSVRIDGIKTPSSALAYIEHFYEEYDWESFVYGQSLTIPETNRLVESLTVTSADDAKTWILSFLCVYTPAAKKLQGCTKILSDIIECYKNDDYDAYSKFDAYKRITNSVVSGRESILKRLNKYLEYAKRYNASDDELKDMKERINTFYSASLIQAYENLEDIPAIHDIYERKNQELLNELYSKGINAEEYYINAKRLIGEHKYTEALNILSLIKGYSDSKKLCEKINKYFLIDDVLEINDRLYFFRKSENTAGAFDLYPTENQRILHAPIIRGISKIVTNYANILYYIDTEKSLKRFDLNTRTVAVSDHKKYSCTELYSRSSTDTILLIRSSDNSYGGKELVELNPATGSIRPLLSSIRKVLSLKSNFLAFTESKTVNGGTLTFTNVINLDTMQMTRLGNKALTIEGYMDGYVIFTKIAPDEKNRNLYVKRTDAENAPEILIENNIYRYSTSIGGRLFYYVGNSRNETLIKISPDGTDRSELPSYISDILFEQGGWMYFIRRFRHNSVLCKTKTDGTEFTVIAADIDRFIGIKNGYLYYVNDVSTLIKIRMDGSGYTELCTDIQEVLSVKENRIVFVSLDDRKTGISGKLVKSIYAVDFDGQGKRKLAYDVETASYYSEEYVYYINREYRRTSAPEETYTYLDTLCRLNIINGSCEKLLDIVIEPIPKSAALLVAIIIAVIAFFVTFIALIAQNTALTVICLIIFLAAVGAALYFNNKRKKL